MVGGELLPLLLRSGQDVRALVREPRRLGPERVNVQIALGDLADPFSMRHAMRGVDTVVHLAATIRDQPRGTIEELNGLATVRLLRSAERAGVKRFVFFSAMGATPFQRTRFFRSKALAEKAVAGVRARVDRVRALDRLPARRPLDHAAGAVLGAAGGAGLRRGRRPLSADLGAGRRALRGAALEEDGVDESRRYELAGPETLSYDEIVEQVLDAKGRRRPLIHVPVPLVRAGLRGLSRHRPGRLRDLGGGGADGGADDERGAARRRGGLGVEPAPMSLVLGGANGGPPGHP